MSLFKKKNTHTNYIFFPTEGTSNHINSCYNSYIQLLNRIFLIIINISLLFLLNIRILFNL